MKQCTCTTAHHDNHPGSQCRQAAAPGDAYCADCRDKEVMEHADTKPDLLSYQTG